MTKIVSFLKADNIAQGWEKAVRAIWHKGHLLEKDEWGSNMKEILNLVVHIRNPLNEPMKHEFYPWPKERLEEYSKEYLNPDKGKFVYTYGERLTNWNGEINQIDNSVIPRLKANKKSRRAIAVTLIPPKDRGQENVPCMIFDHFVIRDGKLHLTTYFRSHDIFGAAHANWYGLARLGEYVAKKVGVEMGSLTSVSGSGHLYEHDWANVKKMLGEE